MHRLKLGVVGCGAVAEAYHLPAIATCPNVELTMLVDKSLERCRQLSAKHGAPAISADYRDMFGKVEAAVVALPNSLHAPVAIGLLRKGIHVLVEKPMAVTTGECDAMIRAAEDANAVLAVGFVRRFYRACCYVKEVLESGLLGKLFRFEVREGSVMDWSAASDYAFRRDLAGGGVLIDVGVHVLDLLIWWLGEHASFEYWDDAMGGVEADCELRLRFPSGVQGTIELSRTRNLSNTYFFEGEKGTLEVGTSVNPGVQLRLRDSALDLHGKVLSNGRSDTSLRDAFLRQIDDFAQSSVNRRAPRITGCSGRRSVQIVEGCYASRKPLPQPWMCPEIAGNNA